MGGEVARHLVASGVGELILVDGDRVAECNLNRQYLYTLRDVGRTKVEAAADALGALRADIRIHTYDTFVDSLQELEQLGLPPVRAVVCCADMPLGTIFNIVSEFATRRRSIFALATVGVDVGCWGPIIVPDEALPYHEWPLQKALPELAAKVIPATASFGPTNSLIAGALARDLLHVLGGDEAPSRGARVFLDFRTLTTTRVTGDTHPDVT